MMLNKLPLNQVSKISQLPQEPNVSIALLEQGFFVGAELYVAHRSPFNGPIAVSILGSKICIQQDLASQIEVTIL